MLLFFIVCCVFVLIGFVDFVIGIELFLYYFYDKIIDYDYKDNIIYVI